ncbi:hypothetical protein N7523_010588 [Penicillium sp. IBT 18751x]|nr:hypothetical protein N7523_010588 [Penicillium sp. IBT 18751x]
MRQPQYSFDSSDDLDLRSPWFSSLWTLQEICLCPQMILMARDWIQLTDNAGTPFTLERLVNLSNMVQKLTLEHSRKVNPSLHHGVPRTNVPSAYPNGPVSLQKLIYQSRMDSGSRFCRTMILIQGSFRQCSGRRAEAIMSAVDVIEWFKADVEQKNELVLGVYPLAFVKEAASKFGPEFAMAQK